MRRRDLRGAKAGTHCLGPCSIGAGGGGLKGFGEVVGWQRGLARVGGARAGPCGVPACVPVVLGVRRGTVRVSAGPWDRVGSASGAQAGGQGGSVDSGGGRAPAAGSWGFPERLRSSTAIPP